MTRSQGTDLFQQLNMVFSGTVPDSTYAAALANLEGKPDMGKVAKNSSLVVLTKKQRDHFKGDWLGGTWWPGAGDVDKKLKTGLIKAIKAARDADAEITFVWRDNATDGSFKVHVDTTARPMTLTVTSPPAKA